MLTSQVHSVFLRFKRTGHALLRLSPIQYLLSLGIITFLLVSSYSVTHWRPSFLTASDIVLPNDLETQTLRKFDEQVEAQKIHYKPTDVERFSYDDFEFEFRIIPTFGRKSILKAEDPDRSKAFEPFLHPDPDELIAPLGSTHSILLNKYAVYRPMLVIPRNDFAPQTDDLDLADFKAVWSLLQAFATPSVVIYNCGVNAGSSQGHKHLQMFPLPSHGLWPSKAVSQIDVSSNINGVPFRHFVLRLDKDMKALQISQTYSALLDLAMSTLVASGSSSRDYNVAMTKEWIALIPRRTAGPGGPFGANAAGMLGLINVPNEQERKWWEELGYTKYLAELGVSWTAASEK